MKRPVFAGLLTLWVFAGTVAESSAQSSAPTPSARKSFNQVFVKVIVPVTESAPKQKGPVVESWVGEQLEKFGEPEYFAVTDWVPVCDGLLEDDIVDNAVWAGRPIGEHSYFPVSGDIPARDNGRVLVRTTGWLCPLGGESNITLPDEPGSRAVAPVRLLVGKKGKRTKMEHGLPYVAVIVTPPPLRHASPIAAAESSE